MGSTPLEYCWFIYKIGARTGRLTGQFETYAQLIETITNFTLLNQKQPSSAKLCNVCIALG